MKYLMLVILFVSCTVNAEYASLSAEGIVPSSSYLFEVSVSDEGALISIREIDYVLNKEITKKYQRCKVSGKSIDCLVSAPPTQKPIIIRSCAGKFDYLSAIDEDAKFYIVKRQVANDSSDYSLWSLNKEDCSLNKISGISKAENSSAKYLGVINGVVIFLFSDGGSGWAGLKQYDLYKRLKQVIPVGYEDASFNYEGSVAFSKSGLLVGEGDFKNPKFKADPLEKEFIYKDCFLEQKNFVFHRVYCQSLLPSSADLIATALSDNGKYLVKVWAKKRGDSQFILSLFRIDN